MSILSSFSRLIKGRGNYFDPDWDNCFSILNESLLKHKSQDSRFLSIHKDLKNWRKSNVHVKMETFPQLFLNIKTFITRFSKLPDLFEESFNERVKLSLGKHIQEESIALLFSDTQTQKTLLSKYFLIKILNDSKEILGSAGLSLIHI